MIYIQIHKVRLAYKKGENYFYKLKSVVNAELEITGQFEWMDLDTDENEHSIEMHLPYIAKVMEKYKCYYEVLIVLK